jgi:hypothetical protein
MAKKDEQKAKLNANDHNRVQGFVFGIHLEGSEAVVTEGIRAFTSAMAKGGMVLAPPAPRSKGALSAPKDDQTTATAATTSVEEETEQPEGEAVEEQEEATVETNGNGTPRVRRKQVPKTPTLLSSLDLNAAAVSLQEFAKAKSPTSISDKYVVVATWFKEQLKTDEINIDHIFTAFRTLDWQTPDDLTAPFRTLKHSKQYFDKGDGVGAYKVTFLATNYVSKMGTTKS